MYEQSDQDDDIPCSYCDNNVRSDASEDVMSDDTDSEEDSDHEPARIVYSQPDSLALKLQKVIDHGKLPPTSFLYIYLHSVFDHALSDPTRKAD
jgi:hypothetical protein